MKKFILKYKYTLLAAAAAIALLVFLYIRFGDYIKTYYEPEHVKEWIMSFGQLSFLVFIALQLLQVILFFIPGEVVQVAGGYIFGTFLGAALSLFGITLGSVATFLIGRKYGSSLLQKILPQKDYEKTRELIDKPKNRMIIFILYLLPGFPKDVLGYVCGITPIKLKWFIIFSTLARIPGIVISTFVGSNLYEQNYLIVGIAIVLMVAVLVVGLLKGDKILERFKVKSKQ